LAEAALKQCPNCRGNLADFVAVCPYCGVAVPVAETVPEARWSGPAPNSGKATASLVCGLVFFCWPATAIAAVVQGHIALSEIRKSAGRLAGRSLAIAGLVLGYVGLPIIPLLIVAAIAIPNLLRARMAANEASAVGTLRTLKTALIRYAAQCPSQGYPPSLSPLGPGDPGPDHCAHADMVDAGLAAAVPTRNGYRFFYSPNAYDGGGRVVRFALAADPVSPAAGLRHYYSDETGVLRSNETGSADAQSEPLE
jgi:type IV pilus assembly protein PilA